MADLPSDEFTLRKCDTCSGLWVDVSDLNRLLLHSNLPGLESIGGKVDPEAMCGQCPDCHVDLVRIEGGEKKHPLDYDTCESCGGVFLESEFEDVSDAPKAKAEIVAFFSAFSGHLKRRAAR
jgi:Zn-finger nucleic acid-binding protein